MTYHQPVLLSEVIQIFDPQPGKNYLDATLGNGGHTLELLKSGATVYGLDADPQNLKISTTRIQESQLSQNFHPILGNFINLQKIFHSTIQKPLNGILFDLGLSQNQQTKPGRGFSFNDPESLDMRLNPNLQTTTAETIINTYSKDDLYQIFSKNSQEIHALPLITQIIKERQTSPITTAQRLADIIRNYYRQKHLRSSLDPATKIFMALRIAVNDELQNLKFTLPQTQKILSPGSTVCLISFHSGEDRIIKIFIKSNHFSQSGSLKPTPNEVSRNPLSRSATLRWFRI